IKFFREWDLLDTPLIKLLSAKKQYQYFALINGNFDFLKQLSYGYTLNGKAASIERKNRNIPTFHTPASLKVGITKVKYLNDQLNFAGSLQIGKKSPQHFPFKQEIVNVYLENITTGKKVKINTFTRPFTIFNFHLKRMTPPASKFSFSVHPVKYVEKLGLGTYKIKIDYKKSKSSKLLSVYLGQPKKGSGSVSTFTNPTGDISFVYGHNTNWETTIKAVPTSDLAIGSTKLPTTVTDVKLTNSGGLIISGSSSEINLTAKIQDTLLPCSF
ncbi:CDP-glycerol:glycerophosphate glycerophosphotransferase, partial [Enterococcus faecium]|nr:CDP-glycerol:glycerophosphate glycerophosphotransferase [Enterococcus faecium]